MKQKKGILLATLTIVTTMILSTFTTVNAAVGSKTLNLKMLRKSGYGYQLANTQKNVWKIYDVSADVNETIYCLKGGPGFGSSNLMDSTSFTNGSPQATLYKNYYDMKDTANIPSTYQTALPDVNSDTYKALVWILDNCYVAPKTNANDIEIQQAAEYKQILLNEAIEYALQQRDEDFSYEFSFLTDDDIDATQQLAVWYFTNLNDDYHVQTFDFWLNTVAGVENSVYSSLSDRNYFADGWDRATACQLLFDYLVNTAKAEAPNYTFVTPNVKPVQFGNTTVVVEKVDNRVVVGPYNLIKNAKVKYSLTSNVTDGKGQDVTDIILLDANKNAVAEGTTLKDLVGTNFYISLPNTIDDDEIEFKIALGSA